jgi:glutathione S-transferase
MPASDGSEFYAAVAMHGTEGSAISEASRLGVSRLMLISHHLCPYVQRAVIVLMEKGVAHDRTDIDLAAKPEWFKTLSPLGKVPLLLVNQRATLFESAAICEFLEETEPGIRLHPEDAVDRARHRAWIEFASATLNVIAGLYVAPDQTVFEQKRVDIVGKLAWLELALHDGAYFRGERFSLVDAAFAPVFRYFDTLEAVLPSLGVFDAVPKVRAWRAALAARPSVQDAVAADYPMRLHAFLQARGSHLSRLMV